MKYWTLLSLGLSLIAGPALAGIVDSPIPAPFTKLVYSVPGVINSGGLATVFSCTNADKVSVTVGVEVFAATSGPPINTAATTAVSLAPGATNRFTTGTVNGFLAGTYINLVLGSVPNGSARMLATSTKILCTAFVVDQVGVPPATSWQLTIVAKTKQKAAN